MASLINPTAEAQSFRNQKYKGYIRETSELDIVAQVRGQIKHTLIYFPPSHLASVESKWGKENLIFLKNKPKQDEPN